MASPATPFDRVLETSVTTGTGTLTLGGAVTGYQSWSVVGDGKVACYSLWGIDGSGIPTGDWEVGFGTYTVAGTTLARTSVLSSSNGGALVNLASGTKRVALVKPAMQDDVDNSICQGRLTLTTGQPVTNTDVVGSSLVYWTPYNGNRIALFNGTGWRLYQFTELTFTLVALTSGLPYDVFIFDNSGTLTLEAVAWTNGTTRATAIVTQDGVYCKSGTLTKRYLGTFYTTSTTTTEDSGGGTGSQVGGKRFLWNMYNRVDRWLAVIDTTDSWTYTTATWRQANGAAGNKVEYVCGLAEDMVEAQTIQNVDVDDSGGNGAAYSGVGVDSTSSRSGLCSVTFTNNASVTLDAVCTGYFVGIPGIGYHFLSWNERGGGSATVTWLGDSGETGVRQSGMNARMRA